MQVLVMLLVLLIDSWLFGYNEATSSWPWYAPVIAFLASLALLLHPWFHEKEKLHVPE